MNLQLIWRH